MSNTDIDTHKERTLIEEFFNNARQTLTSYFEARQIAFSNAQIFAFTLVSPITIAIASDGNLDLTETTMLVDIASYLERIQLPQDFNELPQPENVLSDIEFKKVIYSELRYLCLAMTQYEAQLIEVLKQLMVLDEQISQEQDKKASIRYRIVEMMRSVIYNNLGLDEIEEAKIKEVLQQLNIEW